MSKDRLNYSEKKFLDADALARRESVTLSHLTDWCEQNDLQTRRIGKQWFIDLNDWQINGPKLISQLNQRSNRIILSPVLLLAVILLFIGLINWTSLSARFRAGSVTLSAAVNTTSRAIFDNQTAVKVASVYDVLWLRLDRFWLGLNYLAETVAQNLIYYRDQATSAWRGFFGQETPAPVTPTLDVATLAAIKAEIKAELLRELGSSAGANVNIKQNLNAPGLVVLPASGDPTLDEAMKLELKNAFSDQVEVRFDPSGQTGVITPILRKGDNYLFVLTPLKR
ncbi:MAG: hypothetical protein V1704_04660 [Candidatus Vogelbacteria bacterium]